MTIYRMPELQHADRLMRWFMMIPEPADRQVSGTQTLWCFPLARFFIFSVAPRADLPSCYLDLFSQSNPVDLPPAHQLHLHWLAIRQRHWHSRASVCTEADVYSTTQESGLMHHTRITLFIVFLCGGGPWRPLWRKVPSEAGPSLSAEPRLRTDYAQITHEQTLFVSSVCSFKLLFSIMILNFISLLIWCSFLISVGMRISVVVGTVVWVGLWRSDKDLWWSDIFLWLVKSIPWFFIDYQEKIWLPKPRIWIKFGGCCN